MDTSWLEDFLALTDCGNFSRAADRRHMTQPTFSRRIRQLEKRVGATLVNRDTHQIELTSAGERFRLVSDEVLRRLHLGREEAIEAGGAAAITLRFASTHALSLTFFPAWLRTLEGEHSVGPISLAADNMQGCERLMLQGGANFLLCHHHPSAATVLDPKSFASMRLGSDRLVPVVAVSPEGKPLYRLPGSSDEPLPFLAYSVTSGMGRILAAARAQDEKSGALKPVFMSHSASALRSLALHGRGIAWSPLCLVAEDLAAGRLVRSGGTEWDVELEIRLVRPRSRQSRSVETFWDRLKTVED